MGDRFLERRAAQRLISRLDPPFNRKIIKAGLCEMSGDHLRFGRRALRAVAQEFGGAPVERSAAALQEAVVGGVLDQHVLESVVRPQPITLDEKDVGLSETPQSRTEFGFFDVRDGFKKRVREVAP